MRFLTAAFLFHAVCLSTIFAPAVSGQEKLTAPTRRTTPILRKPNSPPTSKSPKVAVALSTPSSEFSQTPIIGPAGSGQFGATVAVLPNGNIVVTDPGFDQTTPSAVANVGAVYLLNGATQAVISTLTGSTANDQVGSGGITVLSNGNFVIRSPNWANTAPAAANAGAVTLGNATTGVSGTVSAANSLVGTNVNDLLGSGGVTALLVNGNYVVTSPNWDGNDLGAATFVNGTTGSPTGAVSGANSLVGLDPSDQVGSGGVTTLSNGNYVVRSPNYLASDVGAATFGNGASGVAGLISTGNSHIGVSPGDFVSSGGVTALTSGNYVVSSPMWNNGATTDVGAATFGNGTPGTLGLVGLSNSLIGSTASDTVGVGGVTALTNGNYVVKSPSWDNGAATNAGAATWGNGVSGTTGVVSGANSLVGVSTNDTVSGAGVTALSNGNYVVRSPSWDNPAGPTVDVGAATFGLGAGGPTGPVTDTNSLVGTTAGDLVSLGSVVALTNGHYVVGSPNWGATDVGAVTWGDGGSGSSGAVAAGNSLTGVTANDNVGGVTALSNGNYVVNSPNWDGGAVNVGAVTLVAGTGPTNATVTAANSLTGSSLNDNVGTGVTALTNGNYVVRSPNWGPTNVGAVTWRNGIGVLTAGTIDATTSLLGSAANDQIGSGGVVALANGNYTVRSPNWDNGAIVNAGAVTYGAGNGVTSVGPIVDDHSVLGTVANGTTAPAIPSATPVSLERLVVGRPSSNTITILNPTYAAVANGNWNAAATWNYGAFVEAHDVIIPSGRTVTLNSNIPAGGTLLIEAGGTLSLSGDRLSGIPIANNGTIELVAGKLNMGANLLSLGCSGTFSGGNANGYVIGTVRKDFCSTGAFTFAIGTANGFSAVDVNVTDLASNPSSLTIFATQTAHPSLFTPNSLKRFWTITETGDLTADLVFHYNDPLDIAGSESTYKLFRVVSGTPNVVAGTLDTAGNTMSTTGVVDLSADWAVGSVAPTAPFAMVSGRTVLQSGRGIANVTVTLTDETGNRLAAVSDPFGFFTFNSVPTGKSYTLSAISRRFLFEPQVVWVLEDVSGLVLTADR